MINREQSWLDHRLEIYLTRIKGKDRSVNKGNTIRYLIILDLARFFDAFTLAFQNSYYCFMEYLSLCFCVPLMSGLCKESSGDK